MPIISQTRECCELIESTAMPFMPNIEPAPKLVNPGEGMILPI